MKYLIGVDTGSTFTDVVCASGDRLEYVKVESTPHDLTVCLIEGVKKCAEKFSTIHEVVSQSEPLRWSSTVATNILAMKTGNRVGLIVTKGFKEYLYNSFKILPFIPRELLVELDEEIDKGGNVVKTFGEDKLLELAECLLDMGARALAVSLQHSYLNPSNERRVKEIINKDYPEYYLGSIETMLASEVTSRPSYPERTISVLLNAYIHAGLVRIFYKGDEELNRLGSRYPMFIVHSSGGMARAAKTVAINTIGSGPGVCLTNASHLANLYDIEPIVMIEMGGTSTDCGIAKKEAPTYRTETNIEGLPLYLYSPDVTSIGVGGGTIARVKNKILELGPLSAGALPGPVCFDLGNEEPTLCDADLVLGYLDPDYYEGGDRRLNKELAVEAIQNLADSLGVTLEMASTMIREIARDKVAQLVKDKLDNYGILSDDCVLIACGGEGPLHACSVADSIGMRKVIVPYNSAIFGAEGCVLLDVVSMCETFKALTLQEKEGGYLSDYKTFNDIVNNLKQNISLDMKAQGFKPEDITYHLELEMEDGNGTFRSTISYPSLQIGSKGDVKAICGAFSTEFAAVKGSKAKKDLNSGIKIDIFRLKGVKKAPVWQPNVYDVVSKDCGKACKGKRKVFWKEGFEETDIYGGERLECGNSFKGPGIVEEEYTTIVVPEGWKCHVDKYLNKIIEKV